MEANEANLKKHYWWLLLRGPATVAVLFANRVTK
jgi:hypothetical protein